MLDHAALVAATNLLYWLERGSSVLLALRALSQSPEEPFRGWLLACLREEAGLADGRRVEDVMRQQARGIHQGELMLLADLLAVERRRGSTTESLDELVEQWMARVRADARRRGTISATLLLSRHMIHDLRPRSVAARDHAPRSGGPRGLRAGRGPRGAGGLCAARGPAPTGGDLVNPDVWAGSGAAAWPPAGRRC